jgi:hypothetical protein
MSVIGSRVVLTPAGTRPYKVVLEYDGGDAASEHPVGTIVEGEALIRERSPTPAYVDRSRWHDGQRSAIATEPRRTHPPGTLPSPVI